MTIDQRRSEEVFGIIEELFANGATSVQPGDVSTALRARNAPMGSWQIRAEFSALEVLERIVFDAESGTWHLAPSFRASAEVEPASLRDAG